MNPGSSNQPQTSPVVLVGAVILSVIVLPGCGTMYYKTMGALGIQKRDILVDRVKETREDQAQAKKQFQSALDQFMSVVDVKGGQLEQTYRKLKNEYEQSQSKAQAVRDRLDSVQRVAGDLFDEWEAELDRYHSVKLQRASRRKLQQTKQRYQRFIQVMKRAQTKMDPVLNAFEDQVLFLKHNLNARAFDSLKGQAARMQTNVRQLVKEMEASIDEADAFIASMGGEGQSP